MRRKRQATESDFSPSQPAYRRSLRRVLLFFLLPVALLLLGGGGLAYLFQGQPLSFATIDQRVETTLQDMVGDAYAVEISDSGLSPALSSVLALRGDGIHVRHRDSGEEVLFIDRINVGLNLVSALTGKPQFDRVVLQGGRISLQDAGSAGAGFSPREMLRRVGGWLAATETAFRDGSIKAIEMRDIALQLPAVGRIRNAPVTLSEGKIDYGGQRLLLQMQAQSEAQAFAINAEWRGAADDGRQLSLGIGDLPTGWWLQGEGGEATGQPLISANLRFDARFPFDAALEPLDPFVKLQANSGTLDLNNRHYDMPSAVASLSVSPDADSAIVENSEIWVGGQVFRFSGRLDTSAENPAQTAFGPYAVTLALEAEKRGGDTPAAQQKVNARLSGGLDLSALRIAFDEIAIAGGGGQFSGSAVAGASEGVAISLTSPKTDIATVIRLWPEWAAPLARDWVSGHVPGAALSDLGFDLSLSPKRLAALGEGGALVKGDLSLKTGFSGLGVNYHNSLPPLKAASGRLSIDGDRLEVASDKAVIEPPGAKPVSVSELSFVIGEMSAAAAEGALSARLAGPAAAVAALADSDPVNAIRPLGLKPADLAGEAKVRIKAAIPLSEDSKVTDWQVDASLSALAAKKPVLGRTFSDGEMEIQAKHHLVTAKGKARVDGFPAQFDLAEPINGASGSDRHRDIRLSVSTDDLARQDIRLAPVVSGPLQVRIHSKGGAPERYEIDLAKADVLLPWVGWNIRRGTTGTALASFELEQGGDVTRLKDFSFRMDGGRRAQGTLSFSKSGLISADMKGITLNKGDDFDVTVARKKGGYDIKASGRYYDSRPVLQMVIHGDGLSSSGGSDVSLSANFGRMGGFNGQVMESVVVRYDTRGGRLSLLDVKGVIGGELSQISAQAEGNATTFRFKADNAGGSLAMVNLYDKMQGGKLSASLTRTGNGPFSGRVSIKDFAVIGEERLASLTAAPASEGLQRASGKLRELDLRRVKFDDLKAGIIKAPSRLEVEKGWLRNTQIGLTFDGILFDEADRMNLRGTFMPLFSISRVLGEIPLIGDILSNGKNSGLIGITYRLRGPSNNPGIAVNPLSIVAPGIFREIFEFRN